MLNWTASLDLLTTPRSVHQVVAICCHGSSRYQANEMAERYTCHDGDEDTLHHQVAVSSAYGAGHPLVVPLDSVFN